MPDHQQRAKALFQSVVELDSAEARAAYLQQHCGDDPRLQAEVQALVDRDGQMDEFLAEPAALLDTRYLPSSEPLGAHIGPYKLRELIGEGGFGLVYVAEQEEPIRRKVALKVIKPGMDSREVIARFEAERQALALMDHPNIAKVIDAGATETGRPYFVMELVRGLTITDYCDQAKLSLRERLKLFMAVCHAVQHAHQKGIIHRDLKPSNVMITLHDGQPVPKVIDFGVAKALNQRLTEHTLYTRHAQILGTPLYMSPEQAELSGLDIDTRSDVYSLGVLLYELLTGRTPFDRETLSRLGYDELRRMVREVDPPRPSARVSTLVGEDRLTVANLRAIDERQHSRTLKGELDWIVMKALEKDRGRRYESPSAFAADIGRYLNDEPVSACPPSTSYRMRKYARRHSALLTTITLVLVTAILGTAASLRYAYVAAIEAERANFAQKESDDREREANIARQRSRSLQYATDIKLASDALAKHDIPEAFSLLHKHSAEAEPSAPRGFEWHLFDRLVTREPVIELDQGDWVNDLAVSADGRWLATTAAKGEVRVYETSTWDLHGSFPTQTGSVNGLAWSPDGELLAAGCSDGGVRIWRFGSSEQIMTIPAHDGEAFDVAISPDGRHL